METHRCVHCGTGYADPRAAFRCCVECSFCGKIGRLVMCHACIEKGFAKRAVEAPTDSWVYDPMGQEYYEDVQRVREVYEDEDEKPLYVFHTIAEHPSVCADSIFENLLEDMGEDASERDLRGVKELRAAIAAFNEANKAVNVYYEDRSKIVVLDREGFDKWING